MLMLQFLHADPDAISSSIMRGLIQVRQMRISRVSYANAIPPIVFFESFHRVVP